MENFLSGTMTELMIKIRPSFFVEDGSYLAFENLQLGYTFPKSKAFSKFRIYVQGFNLLTFTKYTGIDPENKYGVVQQM